MAILNFVISNMAQSGDIPTFVYFDTNDSIAQVTTPGYLNQFVAQNNQITDYNMALVATVTDGVQQLQLYTLVFASAHWTLVPYGANPFPYIELINGLGDTIILQPPATSFTDVVYTLPPAPAASGDLLSSTTAGVMSWVTVSSVTSTGNNLGAGSGLYVNNSGSVLNFNSLVAGQGIGFIPDTGAIIIVNDLPFDDTANQTVSGTWDFTNATVKMPALANVVTANAVYFNTSTGLLTYGAGATPGISRVNVTTATQAMIADTQYTTNDASAQVVYTLPVSAPIGSVLIVVGNSALGWAINQNAGQNIQVGAVSSSIGVGGSVVSMNQFDGLSLVCTVANTTFVATSVVGNITVT